MPVWSALIVFLTICHNTHFQCRCKDNQHWWWWHKLLCVNLFRVSISPVMRKINITDHSVHCISTESTRKYLQLKNRSRLFDWCQQQWDKLSLNAMVGWWMDRWMDWLIEKVFTSQSRFFFTYIQPSFRYRVGRGRAWNTWHSFSTMVSNMNSAVHILLHCSIILLLLANILNSLEHLFIFFNLKKREKNQVDQIELNFDQLINGKLPGS